jgi:hypothetical protein
MQWRELASTLRSLVRSLAPVYPAIDSRALHEQQVLYIA